MIFALVPLTVYQVAYELARGRPYSKLEELMLKSVGARTVERGHSFAELRELFQVHDRLLTEALVTLIQEGWVAMEQSGTEIRYLATEEGRRTIDKGRRPSNRRTRTASATIVRERLTGQLARFGDVSPIKATSLRSNGTRKAKRQALTPKVMRTKINGGETERLLPRSRQNQEWVRWISSVSQVSRDLHYLPVRVDLEAGTVAGLPSAWQHLTAPIMEEVAERSAQLTDDEAFQDEIRAFMTSRTGGEDTARKRELRPFATVHVSCADTAITAVETAHLIDDALTKGVSRVLLAVSNLDERRTAAAADLLTRLASEAVKVDVLWSLADPTAPSNVIFNHLTRARADAPRDTLIFNSEPSNIAADLLLAETADGPVGIVGCSVTEPGLGDNALSVAVRITDPSVLAALARLGSGYWDTVNGDQAKLVAHRWNYYAERWAEEGTLAVAPEQALTADSPCPYHSGGHCWGEIAILTGTQAEAARSALLGQQDGRRLILSEGSTATATLITEFIKDGTDLSACLYQAFGGSDGWYFMRRGEPGKWVDHARPDFTPPSPSQRVTGTATQWLISPIGGPQESSLSIRLTGHIATTAWKRTSRAYPVL
jgi:hypothetical protein